MYFLFSGEGPTYFGIGSGTAVICAALEFLPGPMAVIVDQIVEQRHGYSLLERLPSVGSFPSAVYRNVRLN